MHSQILSLKIKELNLLYSQIGGHINLGSSKRATGSKTGAGSLNKTFIKRAGKGIEAR